ncbi:MAG: lamin tail domain-containing protein [Candidatus Nitrosotenuis sp.]
MRTLPIAAVFASLLFVGIFGTSYAAEGLADHVVINEVDTNPTGDDSKSISEWIELFNPTNEDVNIGGWKIASTTVTKKALTLPAGTTIKAGQFLVYSYQSLWFTDVSEKVQLKDKEGRIVDETQVITDQKNDFQSWQRKYDGIVSGSNSWIFKTSSAGSSNGKLSTAIGGSSELTVYVKADKKNYVFDETAIISGNVSKQVYQEKPLFSQQQLLIDVSGPGKFQRTITIYPDLNLQYKTQIKLDKVLGAVAGTYTVNVSYGAAYDTTIFSVGEKKIASSEEEATELTISTDKAVYIPSQTVLISASTSKIIPGEGLKYVVYNANHIQIFSGKLYPNQAGMFSGNVYMSPTKPIYGTLDIIADYGEQHAETSFELAKDVKDTERILLVTDKDVYAPGEPIVISGRSNKHVVALDLEVIQSGTTYLGGYHRESTDKIGSIFKIKDQVKLAGDSTFRYELKIPADKDNLGDFRVTVSKEFGNASIEFKIVENPEEYVAPAKYFVKVDKEQYVVGDTINVSGHVELVNEQSSQRVFEPVHISIMNDQGKQITIVSHVSKKQLVQDKVVDKSSTYSFTSIPDAAGNFKLDFKINPSSFTSGVYTIRASYDKRLAEVTFVVNSDTNLANRNLIVKTDKSVYGLGETVKLEGTLVSGQSAVKIILTKPDGKTMNAGAKIDNSRFTWSWTAPIKDYDLADIRDPRQARPSVFGTYKISVIATSENTDVFFKISKDPANDTLEIKPLEVKTDKAIYRAGEKLLVTGAAIKRQSNADTSLGTIKDRVSVEIRTMSNKVLSISNLDLDNGGAFKSTHDLPLTIFKDGKYKVVATYQRLRADTTFEVKTNIPLGTNGKISLVVVTDKEQYLPGDTVHITGSTNKVLSLTTLDLVVDLKKEGVIDCGKFYCGLGGKAIDISRTYENGLYSYDYKIPINAALGTYDVKADTDFGTFTTSFEVVDKLAKKANSAGTKISEKFNRIADPIVEIGLFEQTKDDTLIAPSAVQGSLIAPRGSEQTVNLIILADDGSCIIGQADDCLVSSPTKTNGLAYKIVTIAGLPYKITYSGHNQILEKFSITPELDEDVIPNSTWIIEAENHTPSTKIYYEIVYKQIQ